jgi:lambda repressor-like predicted transcriptional regulator
MEKKGGSRTMRQTHPLEQILQEKKMSLQKVSELTGVSQLALEYMVYKNLPPKRHIAQKIAKVLQKSVEDIWPNLGR